jgi:hypothetical protein
MDDSIIFIIAGVGLLVGGYLVTRSWFWLIASGIGAIASFFSVIASIIHFQILGALGFTLLTFICIFIFRLITDD